MEANETTTKAPTPKTQPLKRKRLPAVGKKNSKKPPTDPLSSTGSAQEVLAFDVAALREQLDQVTLQHKDGAREEEEALPDEGTEITVRVVKLSSTGEGLAVLEDGGEKTGEDGESEKMLRQRQIYAVAYTIPGDIARVKIYRHGDSHSVADLVEIITPGRDRDDGLIKCRYFGKCQGCQLQMVPYEYQLEHKQVVVKRAYENLSGLEEKDVPEVRRTIGSPLEYGYRTKLTPHFDGPPGARRRRKRDKNARHETCPDIGFMMKGRTIDIEDCPIGTEVIRKGLTRERERMKKEFGNYGNGATILLRESTERFDKNDENIPEIIPEVAVRVTGEDRVDIKTCISDFNALTTEYVDSHVFVNPAGAFFQNNNSILPIFVEYIRKQIHPPTTAATASSHPKIKYLLDAYCGSGFFTICLSSLFASSVGLDVAESSIKCAAENARRNNLPPTTKFVAAPANQLFGMVEFPPDETVVVIDPPRKGCDELFLNQLLRFGPRRVLYVSCNVHTQARDVGYLVRGGRGDVQEEENEEPEAKESKEEKKNDEGVKTDEENKGKLVRYEVESLVGFDFFPQTHHVEGVAVLSRVDNRA